LADWLFLCQTFQFLLKLWVLVWFPFEIYWLVEEALTEWCLKENIVGCLLI
jgi:hypothetical protein